LCGAGSSSAFACTGGALGDTGTGWTGGSRVLVEGHFKPSVALKAAIFLGCTGLLIQLFFPLLHPRFAHGRGLALLMLVWAWEYSAPPLRLHSRGLGEVTVAGIVTCLTPLYGAQIQSGSLSEMFAKSPELILALLPIMVTQVGRMIVMNIPDVKADQAVGKKTFVVQFGIPFAINIYLLIQALAYGALPFLYYFGLPLYVVVGFIAAAPLGIYQGIKLYRGDWKSPDLLRDIPFQCTMHVFSTAAFVTLGFMTS